MLFQFRDVSLQVLERMEAALRALVREANRRERCSVVWRRFRRRSPAVCDPAMMQALPRRPRSLRRAPGRNALRRRA